MPNKYVIPLPDGKVAEKTTPDYVTHCWAVIGLLKLKMQLPPLNPDVKDEEPRYRRYQRWVLCSTTETEVRATRMAANPVYPEATLETRVVPITAVPYVSKKAEEPELSLVDLYPVGSVKKLDLPGITWPEPVPETDLDPIDLGDL